MATISQLVKTGAISINDADDCLPFTDIRIILNPAKENEHVTGLGPGRLKIPIAGSERPTFRCAEDIYVNFTILVIGGTMTLFL